jgi:16S rRNA (adenine1518-N6/adenine1519-N6)-dimethyltransferase
MIDKNFDNISQLREYFLEKNFHPKKQFGQNFLVDKNYIKIMLDASAVTNNDLLLEIGPGGGILTRALIATNQPVISVEIDDKLVTMASDLIGTHPNWTLLHTDVMSKKSEIHPLVLNKLNEFKGSKIKCIANLPYAIITPFLITLLSSVEDLDCFTVLIQEEIAEKICSSADQKTYGILSVIMGVWGESAIIKKVPHQAFWPQPNVTSAIVHIKKKDGHKNFSFLKFSKFVKEMFLHRRKKVTQQMKLYFKNPEEILSELEINLEARPENISPKLWQEIFLKIPPV